ncbi:MAG TPA: hypothetical protein PJ982_00075, partial [Lacipirellulaceae bacterium]|nr:hypothetical protein [Lacipirellulaceae bacterium]
VVLKTVKDNQAEPVTHRNYSYVLAQLRGDVAVQLYGGSRHKEAVAFAFISKGNLKSTLEYFAGTWERVDQISTAPVNIIHEQALWYCFALGLGFGERVQAATLQSKRGGQYVLDAKISIWPGKTHDAQLVVDGGGLVRQASVNCDRKRIRSTSSGTHTIPASGTRIASQGRIEVKTPGGRELVNLSVELKDIQPNLTASDFATLSDLSASDGAPVYYWKDGYNSAPERVGDADRPQNSTSYTLILALAFVMAALVAFAIHGRWRLKV